MVQNNSGTTGRELPTDYELESVVEENAQRITQLLEDGTPGTTRVYMIAGRTDEGNIEARIRSTNRNATPHPALSENEVELWTIAGANDWPDESYRDWWLSGDGVVDSGLDVFDERREGPADARY